MEEAVKFTFLFRIMNRYGEQSVSKCVAITIETRPDYCLKPHLNNMLRYGCTRIEIGVQSVYEVVLVLLYEYRMSLEIRIGVIQ